MQLAALSARDADGSGKEAAGAATAAHGLLLALCLDPAHGLLPHATGADGSQQDAASFDSAVAHSGAKAVAPAVCVQHPRSGSERVPCIVDMPIRPEAPAWLQGGTVGVHTCVLHRVGIRE